MLTLADIILTEVLPVVVALILLAVAAFFAYVAWNLAVGGHHIALIAVAGMFCKGSLAAAATVLLFE